MAEFYRWFANGVVNFHEGLNPDKSDKRSEAIPDTNTTRVWTRFVVFSKPGVYKVNLGITFTRVSDDVPVSNTGTFTFIVGDVGDLQVHDAGLHGALPRGQKAYTLRAENNLDGTAELVEVELTGVPQGARAEVSGDGGRYDRGACNENGLCDGIWKIGNLESRDYRYLSGRSDGPTLTLLVDGDDPKPITATIASKQTRTVTAGGQTYNIEVFDLDDSDSKDVSVAVGTGRGERDPEEPRSLRVDRLGSIALLLWDAVEKVSRWPVAYYEVERNGQILALELRGTLYVDLRRGSGNASYRVRAVSDQGVVGPWSSRSRAGAPEVRTDPGDFTATVDLHGTKVRLEWLPAPTSGSTVDRYQIEWRQRTSDDWDCLREFAAGPCPGAVASDATSTEHEPSLEPGVDLDLAGRYYRIGGGVRRRDHGAVGDRAGRGHGSGDTGRLHG